MAELETTNPSSCCSSAAQETCCEPGDKAECCGESHGDGCGCSAGKRPDAEEVRERVRERYAAAAVAAGTGSGACCGDSAVITGDRREAFGAGLYADDERDALRHRPAEAGRQIVENHGAMARIEQGQNHMAPDIARAAGH